MTIGPDNPNDGSTPRPDPTVLTTEQLIREIAGLRHYLESKLEAETKLTAERFTNITGKLAEIERARLEQKQDVKAAVDAAFAAQKEAAREQVSAADRAIAKTEKATNDQLAQMTVTFTAQLATLIASLDAVKERVGRIESVKAGGKEAFNGLFAVVGAVVSLLVIVDIILAFTK